MIGTQRSLLGWGEPGIDGRFRTARRIELGRGAWVDRVQGWVDGHEALFDVLEHAMRWRTEERPMYDRVVAVPRLLARAPKDGPGHPLLGDMREALGHRYGVGFSEPSLALYRDGRDSVAWHRDQVLRELDEAHVAVVTLGGPRRFMLRPHGGGESVAFSVGWGDLVVMGGSCQRTWEHSVPKQRRAEPRMALMFRHPCRTEDEDPE